MSATSALAPFRRTGLMAATEHLGEGPLLLLDYAMRWLRVGVLLALWRIIVAGHPEASPLPLATLLSYTLVSEAFSPLVRLRTQLANSLWQGELVQYFLRPAGIVRQFLADAVGRSAVDLALLSLPLVALAPLLGVRAAPADPWALPAFAASVALAVAVGLAVEFLSGIATLILDQPVWLIEWVRRAVVGLMAGAILPLPVLPWGLGEAFAWLPFASMTWAPLAIYTGADDALPLLALQLGWALALWPVTLWLWARNRERVVGYGG